jgi:hypothetical protein
MNEKFGTPKGDHLEMKNIKASEQDINDIKQISIMSIFFKNYNRIDLIL